MPHLITLTQEHIKKWLANTVTGRGKPAIVVEYNRALAVEDMKRAAQIFDLEIDDQTGERAAREVWEEIAPVRLDRDFRVSLQDDGTWQVFDWADEVVATLPTKATAIEEGNRLAALAALNAQSD